MPKVLSNGRIWGRGTKVDNQTHKRVVQLLRSTELPFRTLGKRLGISAEAVSSINISENYIRPKGFRPPR